MAFIRSKIVKGQEYFYLVENIRKGKKVTQKVIKYLGKNVIGVSKTLTHLTVRDINAIHEKVLKKFGGERGIISPGTVDFASDYLLDRRYDTKDFKKNIALRAGKLMHFIISRHPFVDGNKRTGFESAHLFLILNGWSINYELDDAVKFCLKISAGDVNEQEVVKWLLEKMKPIRSRV